MLEPARVQRVSQIQVECAEGDAGPFVAEGPGLLES